MIQSLSLIGGALALVAIGCVRADQTSKLFGKIHWSIIGIIGYTMIATTTSIKFATPVLALLLGLITIGLIIKARRIEMRCPICPLIWVVNAVIVILAFVPTQEKLN